MYVITSISLTKKLFTHIEHNSSMAGNYFKQLKYVRTETFVKEPKQAKFLRALM